MMTDIVIKGVKNGELPLNLLCSTIATIADPRIIPHFLNAKKETAYGHSHRDESQDALEKDIYHKIVLYVMKKLLETSDENFDVFQSLLQSARSLALKNAEEKKRPEKKEEQEAAHDPTA